MTFEQAISRLDEITEQLSDGNTTLEKSLELYAEGAALASKCQKELEQAKLKIEKLKIGENSDEL